ncbi:hypothetical protein HK101_001333 [Irineochytrium annulatum]|nr:hypothetical protein HK101_001333 [Irineochytrium annulatum]
MAIENALLHLCRLNDALLVQETAIQDLRRQTVGVLREVRAFLAAGVASGTAAAPPVPLSRAAGGPRDDGAPVDVLEEPRLVPVASGNQTTPDESRTLDYGRLTTILTGDFDRRTQGFRTPPDAQDPVNASRQARAASLGQAWMSTNKDLAPIQSGSLGSALDRADAEGDQIGSVFWADVNAMVSKDVLRSRVMDDPIVSSHHRQPRRSISMDQKRAEPFIGASHGVLLDSCVEMAINYAATSQLLPSSTIRTSNSAGAEPAPGSMENSSVPPTKSLTSLRPSKSLTADAAGIAAAGGSADPTISAWGVATKVVKVVKILKSNRRSLSASSDVSVPPSTSNMDIDTVLQAYPDQSMTQHRPSNASRWTSRKPSAIRSGSITAGPGNVVNSLSASVSASASGPLPVTAEDDDDPGSVEAEAGSVRMDEDTEGGAGSRRASKATRASQPALVPPLPTLAASTPAPPTALSDQDQAYLQMRQDTPERDLERGVVVGFGCAPGVSSSRPSSRSQLPSDDAMEYWSQASQRPPRRSESKTGATGGGGPGTRRTSLAAARAEGSKPLPVAIAIASPIANAPPGAAKVVGEGGEVVPMWRRVWREGRKRVRAWLVEECYTPSFNEFKEGTQGSMERRFWIDSVSKGGMMGLHPLSKVVVVWEFILSLFHIFTLFSIPIIVSFENLAPMIGERICLLITGVYFLRVIIALNTLALVDAVTSVRTMSASDSRRAYLMKYLVIDLIAAVPWANVLIDAPSNGATFSAMALLNLLGVRDLFQLFKMNPIHHLVAEFVQRRLAVGANFMSIFTFGGMMVVFFHFHACLIFLLGRLTGYEDGFWGLPDSVAILDKGTFTQYIWAMFKTTANTFPVTGFVPTGAVEQVITVLCVLFGALLYAALVGTISSFSLGLDSSGRKFKEIMDEVNEYMEHEQVNTTLRTRVRELFQLKYHGKYFDKESIMAQMNQSLMTELTIQTLRPLISKVPFLKREAGDQKDEEFLTRVAFSLRPEYFIHGDPIVRQGDVSDCMTSQSTPPFRRYLTAMAVMQMGEEMFFIEKGTVDIEVNGNVVGALRDGAFFGEVALLDRTPRTATIRASSNAKLHRLSRNDVEQILADFPDVAQKMKQVYEERMQKIRAEQEAKLLQERQMEEAARKAAAGVIW